MALLSFKNVGVKLFETQKDILSVSQIPIGIKTPVEMTANGFFKMNFNIADQVHDNLRNLILTNHGERVVLYDFGADLYPLLTEFSNLDSFNNQAMININTAVSKYMPFVSLVGFDSAADFKDNRYLAKIKILLVYSVTDLNIIQRSLEVILNVI